MANNEIGYESWNHGINRERLAKMYGEQYKGLSIMLNNSSGGILKDRIQDYLDSTEFVEVLNICKAFGKNCIYQFEGRNIS